MSAPAVEAFERAYAERSGITVEALHRSGRFGAPCACREPGCDGFQMLHLLDELVAAGWTPPADAITGAGLLFMRYVRAAPCDLCGHTEYSIDPAEGEPDWLVCYTCGHSCVHAGGVNEQAALARGWPLASDPAGERDRHAVSLNTVHARRFGAFGPPPTPPDGPCTREWHELRKVKRAARCPGCNEAS